MQATTDLSVQAATPVPLTIEGASVLHQMFRVRWPAWKQLPGDRRTAIVTELQGALEQLEKVAEFPSALFSLIGHKGDLMFVHFRESFAALHQAEVDLAKLQISDYLEPVSSYLSIVELGLYESTAKTYESLSERGVQAHSAEWKNGVEEVLARQREAMRTRLYPAMPPNRYICFYPMDRKRGETKNWYRVSLAERQQMMHDHGTIGRRYAGEVKQIITGSIGLDDWEWGVDLFADDPVTFKRLIYEMRFDEVSADYALFGQFYIGLRCRPSEIDGILL